MDFICDADNEITPLSNKGAAFLLVYTLLLLTFSLMIWFVLYKIPDRHGLISKRGERLAVDEKLGNSEILETSTTDDKNPLQNFISSAKQEE